MPVRPTGKLLVPPLGGWEATGFDGIEHAADALPQAALPLTGEA